MTIGDVIKKYRIDNNLTYRSFADKCGLSHSYISALEKNIDPRTKKPIAPTLNTIKRIAKVLNVEPHILLESLDDDQLILVNSDNGKKNLSDFSDNEILEYLMKKNSIIPNNYSITTKQMDIFIKFIKNNKDILF